MSRSVVSVLLFALVSGCAMMDSSTGPALAPGTLEIALERSSYTPTEASQEGIRGTIHNTSDRDLYSNIGDAMLISVDQDPLLIANLSDGAVERLVGTDAWARVPTASSIEGTRFVLLRHGQTYHFIGQIVAPAPAGTHRVAITFRTTINDEQAGTTSTDYSPTFEIR